MTGRHSWPAEWGESGVDLVAVARDDRLIDAIARGEDILGGDEAAQLLAAWRADLDEAPAPENVPVLALGEPGTPVRRRATRRRRVLQHATVATATVAVLSMAGVSAAERATPGSLFWPLAQILNDDRADSLTARDETSDRLDTVRNALEDGRIDDAQKALDDARHGATQVRTEDGREELDADIGALDQKITEARGERPTQAAPGPAGDRSQSQEGKRGGEDDHRERPKHPRDDEDGAGVPVEPPGSGGSGGSGENDGATQAGEGENPAYGAVPPAPVEADPPSDGGDHDADENARQGKRDATTQRTTLGRRTGGSSGSSAQESGRDSGRDSAWDSDGGDVVGGRHVREEPVTRNSQPRDHSTHVAVRSASPRR